MEKQDTNGKRIMSITTKRLPELRNRLGDMSQEDFAKSIDISPSMISKIERGDKGLTLDLAIKICDKYRSNGVSLDWLFERCEDMENKASDIIVDLREIFKIGTIKTPINGISEPHLTLAIDKDLEDFIKKLEQAEDYKKEGLPEDGYIAWVAAIKRDYALNSKSNIKDEPKEYVCIPSKWVTRGFIEDVLAYDKYADENLSPAEASVKLKEYK